MALSSRLQVLACMAACGGLLSSGMTVAFPSVSLSRYTTSASWIASASHLAMIAGSLFVGPFLDNRGRKFGLLASLTLSFLGWLTLGLGGWVVGGRLLTGLSAGLASAPASVLVAEISSDRLRAPLTTLKHIAFSTGLVIMYAMGLIFKDSWARPCQICAGLSLMGWLAAGWLVPETRPPSSHTASYSSLLAALPTRPDLVRSLSVMGGLSVLKQLAGTTVLLSYAAPLLEVGGVKQAGEAALFLGLVRLGASLSATPLAAAFGRRSLASFSGWISSLTLLLLAGGGISLTPLLIHVYTSAIFSSAIQAVIGEVFPPDFRGVCTGLTSTLTYMAAFAALYSHPWLLRQLALSSLLGLYGTSSAAATILAIFCFPRDTSDQEVKPEKIYTIEPLESMVPLKDMSVTQVESEKG